MGIILQEAGHVHHVHRPDSGPGTGMKGSSDSASECAIRPGTRSGTSCGGRANDNNLSAWIVVPMRCVISRNGRCILRGNVHMCRLYSRWGSMLGLRQSIPGLGRFNVHNSSSRASAGLDIVLISRRRPRQMTLVTGMVLGQGRVLNGRDLGIHETTPAYHVRGNSISSTVGVIIDSYQRLLSNI